MKPIHVMSIDDLVNKLTGLAGEAPCDKSFDIEMRNIGQKIHDEFYKIEDAGTFYRTLATFLMELGAARLSIECKTHKQVFQACEGALMVAYLEVRTEEGMELSFFSLRRLFLEHFHSAVMRVIKE